MQVPHKTALRLTVAALLPLVALAPGARAATLTEARDTYDNNRVSEAEAMLDEIAADPAVGEAERAQALRELGRIDGLVRAEVDAIAAAMAQTSRGEERCATAATALRIYREVGEPATPLAYAKSAGGECAEGDSETLRIELARTHIALARTQPGAHMHLDAAAAQLAAIDEAARGAPAVASTRFALALARRDANAAFAAWRDYYWLTEADAPQAMGAYAGRVSALFQAGLAADAPVPDRLALIEMLIRAGFTSEARHLAEDADLAGRASDNPTWRWAAAFFTFHETVRETTLRANREMAAGGGGEWYEDAIGAAAEQLMQSVGLSGDPRDALAQSYSVFGTIGLTDNYPSLHAGHAVRDERIAVAQYGRTAELRFIVIDNMVANGFWSWLWDGSAQAGGWSNSGDTIVQVRSAYTAGPLNALRRARPGPFREQHLARITRDERSERAALGDDGVATLPATGARLRLQAIDRIAAHTGGDDAAFIAEYWRAFNQSTIEHEGRHALDKLSGRRFSDATYEFRGKLSEIALADYPRLSLSSIVAQTLSDTPHGNANRRILQGYRARMRRHRDEIAGFDRGAPALSQLHLLSDDQIRAVARSLDPWAQ